jgi:hypothetical protein
MNKRGLSFEEMKALPPEEQKKIIERISSARKLGKSCLPVDNTEVLTQDGWKSFNEIKSGEYVMSLNKERKQVWCKVLDKVFYECQPVKTLSHRSWCVESTGNHKWLVDKRVRTKSNPWVKTFYEETDKVNSDMNIITTGEYIGGDSSVSPDQARLLGWILSDGYLHVSKLTKKTSQGKMGQRQYVRMSIAQSPKKYLNEIKELLEKLNLTYREDKITASNGVLSLTIPSVDARNFIKSVGLPLKSKHEIDYTQWICSLNTESLHSFIDAFWKADGLTSEKGKSKKSLIIYQNLGRVYDAIQLALHLTGKNTTVSYKSKSNMQISAQGRPHITCQRLRKQYTRDTDVFCLITENGNFLIRQGNVLTITGNCNYSAVYGAGAPKISQTAGVDLTTGKLLHESYWKLNWSVQAIAEEQFLVEFPSEEGYNNLHKLWLVNPINGFMYAIRAKKDVFSTLCQGSGSYFFDMWLKHILRRQKEKFGVNKIQLQMHDEVMFSFKDTEKFKSEFKSLIKGAVEDVNKEFNLRRKLDVDVQFGKKYSEIH